MIKLEELFNEALDYNANSFLKLLQTVNRAIKNLDDITVNATSKGNWIVYYKNKKLVTVRGDILNDTIIRKYNLEHHYD